MVTAWPRDDFRLSDSTTKGVQMDVSTYGLVELEESELIRIEGGCELFCEVAKGIGWAYQKVNDGAEAAYRYVRDSDTGTPSYYSW
ncbi:MAG TPA: hypothetical protein VFI91_11825 [Longimicrobiaceae bacterium]|nr:hypothetical protein [Longimicrobiaceae bacterium]